MKGHRWFDRISLRAKLVATAALVLSAVMLGAMVLVEYQQRVNIVRNARTRGTLLARNLAAVSTNALLLYNYTALEQYATNLGREPDVVYAIILDKEGKVAAYSGHPEYAGSLLRGPVDLAASKATEPLIADAAVQESGEPAFDVALPVYVEGVPEKWGTIRIGLSKTQMMAEITQTRWKLLVLSILAILVGAGVSAYFAGRIGRPIRELVRGVGAVAQGDLNQQVAVKSRDELGTLADAFNQMAAELLRQRTELEEAHNALKERFVELSRLKNYMDNVLQSMTSGVITLDLDGRIVTFNEYAERLTGFRFGEIRGLYCRGVFRESKEFWQVLLDTLISERSYAGVNLTFTRTDGGIAFLELTTSLLRGAEGEELGVLGVFRDLTALRELEDQLRRADRLAALGTMAAGLAHEIKNPLTSIHTLAQLLPRRYTEERFREMFHTVVPRELDRITAIVDGLLQLARPARLKLEPTHVHELLDRAVELYEDRIAESGVEVERRYDPALPEIMADPELLYRAFVNMALNAIDAISSTPGRLTLSTRVVEQTERSWPYGRSQAGDGRRSVEVQITDTGVGISKEDAGKLFNPFFSTKKGGTGLGLALTHKIVEDHGGQITFQSQVGVGTTFTILLPLRGPAPAHAA